MVVLTASAILTRARVAHLQDVIKLNVWGCSLTDIDIVAMCHNLQVFSASCNDISSVKELQFCSALQELYMRENQITDIQEIFHLTKLPQLKVLWLAGNPCCDIFGGDDQQYRLWMLKHLPRLERLDNIEVQSEERKRAQTISDERDFVQLGRAASTANSVSIENAHQTTVHIPQSIQKENSHSSEQHLADDISRISSRSGFNEIVSDAPAKVKRPVFDQMRPEVSVAPLYPSAPAGQMDRVNVQAKLRNVNILSAVLSLVKELDQESLQLLQMDINQRLKDLQSRPS